MDIRDWFTPESPDDVDGPDEFGYIFYDGEAYTPTQVREFARQLLDLADAADKAVQRHG